MITQFKKLRKLAEKMNSVPVPLFDGPSKQAAVLVLESCGINVLSSPKGFRLRSGERGRITKTHRDDLREAILDFKEEGPRIKVSESYFEIEIAAALAGATDEKPYRALVACYQDAVDLIEARTVRRFRDLAEELDKGFGLPSDEPLVSADLSKKVIPFPPRSEK